MITIFLAEKHFIARAGLISMISVHKDMEVVGEAIHEKEIIHKSIQLRPDVLIIDYTHPEIGIATIKKVLKSSPEVKILAISNQLSKSKITQAIDAGICSHILKECDQKEVTDAIYATAKGQKFFCGKVLDTLTSENEPAAFSTEFSKASCNPVTISNREIEIIKLIAEGYTNRQMADMLFISTHTVTTHRKKVMAKLGIKNTAGLVMFAVKEKMISPNQYLFSSLN